MEVNLCGSWSEIWGVMGAMLGVVFSCQTLSLLTSRLQRQREFFVFIFRDLWALLPVDTAMEQSRMKGVLGSV